MDGYHPKAGEIVSLVHSIRKATTILVKYNDTDTVKMLGEWKDELEGMLATVRKDTSSEAALSKSVTWISMSRY